MENELISEIKNEEIFEKNILSFVERLDFIDIIILKKFYVTGKEFPNDTQPYCFPLLYQEMKKIHHLKIGIEALRKRLDGLVKLGLLEKIKKSNPSFYSPIRGREDFVRNVITKFFVVNGITKFLWKIKFFFELVF